MTKAQLEKYGRTIGIELDKRHTKTDLISELKPLLNQITMAIEEKVIQTNTEPTCRGSCCKTTSSAFYTKFRFCKS